MNYFLSTTSGTRSVSVQLTWTFPAYCSTYLYLAVAVFVCDPGNQLGQIIRNCTATRPENDAALRSRDLDGLTNCKAGYLQDLRRQSYSRAVAYADNAAAYCHGGHGYPV